MGFCEMGGRGDVYIDIHFSDGGSLIALIVKQLRIKFEKSHFFVT